MAFERATSMTRGSARTYIRPWFRLAALNAFDITFAGRRSDLAHL